MGWKSNQVQRLSVGLLTLFIASLDASQNSVNQSIKKHQSTFENVAIPDMFRFRPVTSS